MRQYPVEASAIDDNHHRVEKRLRLSPRRHQGQDNTAAKTGNQPGPRVDVRGTREWGRGGSSGRGTSRLDALGFVVVIFVFHSWFSPLVACTYGSSLRLLVPLAAIQRCRRRHQIISANYTVTLGAQQRRISAALQRSAVTGSRRHFALCFHSTASSKRVAAARRQN